MDSLSQVFKNLLKLLSVVLIINHFLTIRHMLLSNSVIDLYRLWDKITDKIVKKNKGENSTVVIEIDASQRCERLYIVAIFKPLIYYLFVLPFNHYPVTW